VAGCAHRRAPALGLPPRSLSNYCAITGVAKKHRLPASSPRNSKLAILRHQPDLLD
jgi:hypothetical protein